MNNNLVSLNKLMEIAKEKGIDKYIKKIGFSNRKYKKYYVITIDNKKVDFGDIRYEDYLIHNDINRLKLFRARFNKLFKKSNYNQPLYYSYQLLW